MRGKNEQIFEEQLMRLNETHLSIATLSSWCLSNPQSHEKIVSIWLSTLKRARMDQRLILFYLANDVIQYSRKKSLPFADTFAPALLEAARFVKDNNCIRPKIERLLVIWKQRRIYSEKYLTDLNSLLTNFKTEKIININDFHPCLIYSRLKARKETQNDSDQKLNILNEKSLQYIENISRDGNFKSFDLLQEIDDKVLNLQDYIEALEAEIREHSGLVSLLEVAENHYTEQIKAAKVVFKAYKYFGRRIKSVQRNLVEKINVLPSDSLLECVSFRTSDSFMNQTIVNTSSTISAIYNVDYTFSNFNIEEKPIILSDYNPAKELSRTSTLIQNSSSLLLNPPVVEETYSCVEPTGTDTSYMPPPVQLASPSDAEIRNDIDIRSLSNNERNETLTALLESLVAK